MKKFGTMALAAAIAVCAGPGAWAGTLPCPVTGSVDSTPVGKAHDADFLFINANALWDNFPISPIVTDNLFSDDDTTIADEAQTLAYLVTAATLMVDPNDQAGNLTNPTFLATMAQFQAVFETAVIPSVIWLGLLERAVTDPDFPNHAAICAAYSDNLDQANAYLSALGVEGFAPLLPVFLGGNEVIAGLMTLGGNGLWNPIINQFVSDAIEDNFMTTPTTNLGSFSFTAAPSLDWTGSVGDNENTNVELWLALGAEYLGGGAWEVTGQKAVFTTAQIYAAYQEMVLSDGDFDILAGTIIPVVPPGAPVSGPVGLGLLTLLVAAGGALVIRRRK